MCVFAGKQDGCHSCVLHSYMLRDIMPEVSFEICISLQEKMVD